MSPQTRTPRQRQGDGLNDELIVRVSTDMAERVTAVALRCGCSKAEVVRQALDAYFQANPDL